MQPLLAPLPSQVPEHTLLTAVRPADKPLRSRKEEALQKLLPLAGSLLPPRQRNPTQQTAGPIQHGHLAPIEKAHTQNDLVQQFTPRGGTPTNTLTASWTSGIITATYIGVGIYPPQSIPAQQEIQPSEPHPTRVVVTEIEIAPPSDDVLQQPLPSKRRSNKISVLPSGPPPAAPSPNQVRRSFRTVVSSVFGCFGDFRSSKVQLVRARLW